MKLIIGILLGVLFLGYTSVGVPTRVNTIKELAPADIDKRNWKILRYEGWEYGSWNKHGGYVWYHVAVKDAPHIQYRVHVTLWDGELHYYYGAPEVLNRVEVDFKNK